MGYRLKPDRPQGAELKRIAAKQLRRAASEVTAAGACLRRDRLHAARKRVKKVRALLRLAAPSLEDREFDQMNRRLRKISRALGRLADSAAVVGVTVQLLRTHRDGISPRTARLARRAVAARDADITRAAATKKIRAQCVRRLLRQQRRVTDLRLDLDDGRSMAQALERSHDRARKAMKNAWRHPDADRLHAWRRRSKVEWLQLRLLEGSADARRRALARQLETLDDVLGDYHNLALVREALEDSPVRSRDIVAQLLRVVERERQALRRRAQALGERIYEERAA